MSPTSRRVTIFRWRATTGVAQSGDISFHNVENSMGVIYVMFFFVMKAQCFENDLLYNLFGTYNPKTFHFTACSSNKQFIFIIFVLLWAWFAGWRVRVYCVRGKRCLKAVKSSTIQKVTAHTSSHIYSSTDFTSSMLLRITKPSTAIQVSSKNLFVNANQDFYYPCVQYEEQNPLLQGHIWVNIQLEIVSSDLRTFMGSCIRSGYLTWYIPTCRYIHIIDIVDKIGISELFLLNYPYVGDFGGCWIGRNIPLAPSRASMVHCVAVDVQT